MNLHCCHNQFVSDLGVHVNCSNVPFIGLSQTVSEIISNTGSIITNQSEITQLRRSGLESDIDQVT